MNPSMVMYLQLTVMTHQSLPVLIVNVLVHMMPVMEIRTVLMEVMKMNVVITKNDYDFLCNFEAIIISKIH